MRFLARLLKLAFTKIKQNITYNIESYRYDKIHNTSEKEAINRLARVIKKELKETKVEKRIHIALYNYEDFSNHYYFDDTIRGKMIKVDRKQDKKLSILGHTIHRLDINTIRRLTEMLHDKFDSDKKYYVKWTKYSAGMKCYSKYEKTLVIGLKSSNK